MLQSIRSHLPWLLTASMIVACGDEPSGEDENAGSETAETETAGTEDDEIGDDASTTDTTTTTDDDDDTTSTTTDDGCSIGSEGCECTQGGGCDPGLECDGGICTAPNPDTTEEGPTTTEGESTETTDTGNTACVEDMSFELLAVDATDVDGFEPQMSMLGEGMIMAWDQENDEAFITWDIDVPCDDTWHIWVRAIDQAANDSFLAVIDGEPNPEAIFEVDCTNNPQQGTYVWTDLNYRDQADPGCTYLFDPWTQDWLTGIHQLTLLYRESNAVAKLWITNTDQPPP